MSNLEHLIENALTATEKAEDNKYQAFVEEMSAAYNLQMLQTTSVTEEDLWEITQYIIYTWMPSANAEPVIHCRDCVFGKGTGSVRFCNILKETFPENGYCSFGRPWEEK